MTSAVPILTLRISARGLDDRGAHCGRLAGYIARFAASDRADPEPLRTRLAARIDEVLQLVGRARPEAGVVLDVVRADAHIVVELALPADAALATHLHARLAGAPADRVDLALRAGPAVTTLVLSVPHE